MYEGRTDLEPGMVIGHENLGQVIEVGSAVKRIKKGDWVCVPFNVSCGYCRNCERGYTGFYLSMNPDPKTAGAAYGYSGMGPYRGGQAELRTSCRSTRRPTRTGTSTRGRRGGPRSSCIRA